MIDLFLVWWLWRDPIITAFVLQQPLPEKKVAPSVTNPDCEKISFAIPWTDGHQLRLCLSLDGVWVLEQWGADQ